MTADASPCDQQARGLLEVSLTLIPLAFLGVSVESRGLMTARQPVSEDSKAVLLLHGSWPPISGRELRQGHPSTLARMNAAYPYPLFQLHQMLGSSDFSQDYLAIFKPSALQSALAQTFSAACAAERAKHELSSPILDGKDYHVSCVPEDAFTLVHNSAKGWQVLTATPIAAGASVGAYTGELAGCLGLGDPGQRAQAEACRRFLDRVIDSYPQAAGLAPADREALRWGIQEDLAEYGPYGFLITLPVPGAPPIKLTIDPMKIGSIARFINHASSANVQRVFVRDVRDGAYFIRIEFLAITDIAPGTELTIDYGYGESDIWEIHGKMEAVHERILHACG